MQSHMTYFLRRFDFPRSPVIDVNSPGSRHKGHPSTLTVVGYPPIGMGGADRNGRAYIMSLLRQQLKV